MQSWLIFGIALLIRLIALSFLVSSRGVLTIADAADYIQFGEYILQQGLWVTDIDGLRAHAGPGYPSILALNMLLFGSGNFYFALLLNCILSGAAVVITFKIAKEFLSLSWSFLAMTWYLIFIPQIWQVQFLGKESLVFCLFTFSIYAIIKFRQQRNLKTGLVLSFFLLYTFLIHSDERYFFYLPFWIFFLLSGNHAWKDRIKKASILVFGIFLLMLPWTIRNTQVYGRPIILTERTAKITDRILGYKEFNNIFREKKISLSTREGKAAYTAAVDSIQSGFELHDPRYEDKLIRSIKQGIKAGYEPRAFSKWEEKGSYALEFWRPFRLKGGFYGHGFRYMEAWNMRRILFSILQYGLILPLLVIALFYVIRKPQTIVIFLMITVAIHFGIHTLLAHAITRYRYPIDPFLILLAFWALSQLFPKVLPKTLRV